MAIESQRQRIEVGDKVRFRPYQVSRYAKIYDGLSQDDVFEVVREEGWGPRRALYLTNKERGQLWIQAWPSALLLIQRGPAL